MVKSLWTSTLIDCNYYADDYYLFGYNYRCTVDNDPNIISKESAVINEVTGSHQTSKSHNDVLGIYASDKTIHFFPKGLEKTFKNIKLIDITICQLKEIHQADLKPFPNLVHLSLSYNEIEVIEEGLFDYNPNLEVVGFYERKLVHIDPNVFDNLNKLRSFWFSLVPCVGLDVEDSKEDVKKL